MKTLKKLSILLFATLLWVGCTDDSNNPSGGDEFLTAKVDGADFSSFEDSIGASIGTGGAGDVLAVQGSNNSGDYIRINITSYTGVGTYTTGDAITNVSSLSYGSVTPLAAWTTTFDIGNGTVEITEDSATHVKGTFSFTGLNSSDSTNKTITQGEFSAKKQ